jgi:light-regulated signal transduction histidine kinase (bacteriophytochrome)
MDRKRKVETEDEDFDEQRICESLNRLTHGIKNFLQSVNGGSHLVNEGLNIGSIDSIGTGWDIVQRGQSQINRLVLSFLVLTNKSALKPEVSDINVLINGAVADLSDRQSSFKKLVRWNENPTLRRFLFDNHGISNVVSILLSQALKLETTPQANDSAGADPVVEIGTAQSDSECLVYVAVANCAPLSGKELESMFDYDHSAHETDSANIRGVHLAAAKKIVAAHGGQLDFKVNEFGSGQFSVRLPMK